MSEYKDLNIVVTGGAGFIGSHLTEALLERGATVRVIDNYSTGRFENLSHLAENDRLQIYNLDIAKDDFSEAFTSADRVFHLAAIADIVPSIEMPEDYFRSNVEGTLRVLEESRAAGVDRFLYAASSSCYGIPKEYPTNERADIGPQYPYALTKYMAEEMVLHWCQLYHLPALSLRLFNVYGPRSRTSGTYGAVFGVFLAQKLAGVPYTVVGDGTQTRDFTFVSDVVDAFIRASETDLIGQVMNVGSGGAYSVNRLVELLGGEVTYIPKRPGEPDCTFADISKIKKLVGWSPTVSFEDGVAEMLAHIDYWREAPVWTPNTIEDATADWFKYLNAEPSNR